jgi:hypothetical protein
MWLLKILLTRPLHESRLQQKLGAWVPVIVIWMGYTVRYKTRLATNRRSFRVPRTAPPSHAPSHRDQNRAQPQDPADPVCGRG